MQAQFSEGDRVKVYGDAWSAANPERQSPAVGSDAGSQVHRVAVIVREMPGSLAERGHREYELDDGSIAHEDVIRRAE